MKDENTIWNYLAFSGAFVFETAIIPYYLLENASHRSAKYTLHKQKQYSY